MTDGTGAGFLGRFQLLLEMGRGGMATLYLARLGGPEQFQKLLVVKRIHDHLADQPRLVDMLKDEARIAAAIHHPNVATTYELGVSEGVPFIAMEYIHGHPLSEIMVRSSRAREPLAWAHAVRAVMDVAAGLHAAHELRSPQGEPLNVVHRDVSPQNVMVGYDGQIKVLDFGIAFAAGRLAQSKAGSLMGKIAYMSPEQAGGQPLDRRSDLFSLGVLLWECLTLRRLFRGESETATLENVRRAELPPLRPLRPDAPAGLEPILARALARNRADRYPSCAAFADALEDLLVSEGAMVSHHQVAKWMAQTFAAEKRLKDKQIQAAMAAPVGRHPKSALGMTAAYTVDELDDATTAVSHHRRTTAMLPDPSATATAGQGPPSSDLPALWIALGVGVGVLLIGAALLWALDQRRSPDRDPRPAVSGNTAPPARSQAHPNTSRPAARRRALLNRRTGQRPTPPPRPAAVGMGASQIPGWCGKYIDCMKDMLFRSPQNRDSALAVFRVIVDNARRWPSKSDAQCLENLRSYKKLARVRPGIYPPSCVLEDLPDEPSTPSADRKEPRPPPRPRPKRFDPYLHR